MVAPIWRSGAATRPIGRRVSEASPRISVSNGRPARRPNRRRIVVPELPQSSASAAACSPRETDPGDARLPRLELDVDPQRPQRRRGREVVAPLPEAARLDDAVAERAEQERAVGDRLVAGDAGNCRAAGRSGVHAARTTSPDSLPRDHWRAAATICRIASSLSARPSRRSAGMRRWPCTRVPSAPSTTPGGSVRGPASGPSGSGRSCGRPRCPRRGGRGRVCGAVEHADDLQVQVVAEVDARGADGQPGRQVDEAGGRAARIPSVTLSAMNAAGPAWSASSERRSGAERNRARVGDDPPGGVDGAADLRPDRPAPASAASPARRLARSLPTAGCRASAPAVAPGVAATNAAPTRAGSKVPRTMVRVRGAPPASRHDGQQPLALAEDVVTEEAAPLLALARETALA